MRQTHACLQEPEKYDPLRDVTSALDRLRVEIDSQDMSVVQVINRRKGKDRGFHQIKRSETFHSYRISVHCNSHMQATFEKLVDFQRILLEILHSEQTKFESICSEVLGLVSDLHMSC